jgi:hydroxyacylglutathione hydrolase
MTDAGHPEIVCLTNGQFQQNCYLIADTDTNEAVIVDPGEDAAMFLAELDRRHWALRAIWLTHGHIDHVLGVAAVKEATDVPIYLHPGDRPLYDHMATQAALFGVSATVPPPPDHDLADGDRLSVGQFGFTVAHTPGHSPGSVSLHGDGVVFGGDVLFRDSVGRIDLPGGDAATLLESIRDHFLTLPDDTVVYSGHGPPTTVGYERTQNPFLTGAYPLA